MTPARFARVAVNVPAVTGEFDYLIPDELTGQAAPGCLVEAPFGSQNVQGIILELVETPAVPQTRPITCLIDPLPVLTAHQMALARMIARDNLAPLAACLTLMLPPGLSQMADTLYTPLHATETAGLPTIGLSPLQQKVMHLLAKRGPLRGRQIDAALPSQEWRKAAAWLEKNSLLSTRAVLPPPGVHPKFVRTVQLACLPREVDEYEGGIESLPENRQPAARRRLGVLRFLVREPWPVEAAWVYASSGASLPDLVRLADEGLVTLSETQIWRDPLANSLEREDCPPEAPPTLTGDQQAALAELFGPIAAGTSQTTLLRGVSGSGKTEIYLRAAEQTLAKGRQVLILVPEISLTPQTVQRFLKRFPGQVGLVHSRLSVGERYDTWQRVRQGKIRLVVGPRSALFTPFPDPGLIVLDEAHDESYAQSDLPPRFNAIQAAVQLGQISGAGVVLGTATPPVDLFYRAGRENWKIVTLERRILAHRLAVQAHLDRRLASGQAALRENPLAQVPERIEIDTLPPVKVVDMRA